MGQTIGEILPLAVGVAIVPIPVIAVILMLFSDRARANSLMFLTGWVVGLAAAMAVLIAIAATQELSSGGQPSDTTAWVMLSLGVVLLALAVRRWRSRPGPGEDPEMPGWMERIDGMRPGGALVLGLGLAALNPKNLLLMAAAAVTIAQAALSGSDTVAIVVVFTLIAACPVAIPTIAYLFKGDRIQPWLDGMKAWLTANDAAVIAVLLLVFGVLLIGKGIAGLTG